MRVKNFVYITAITILLLVAISGTAFAQDMLSLTISPLRFELEAKKGQTITREVTISNVGSHAVTMQSNAMDFVAEGKGGKPHFVSEAKSPWSMSRWITTNPVMFSLNPGESKKVPVIIKVPKDAEPGGHYAAVLFANSSAGGGNTAVVANIGSLVLLKVDGKIKEAARASLSVPRLSENRPINLALLFENSGNIHVKPKGTITISRLWGRQIAKLDAGGENVLPKSSRLFAAKWKEVPSVGIFVAQGRFSYGAAKSTAITPKVIFFVLPWRMTLAALAIFTLGVAFSFLIRRNKDKHIEKKA